MTVYSHNANDVTPAMAGSPTGSVVVTSNTAYGGSYAPWNAFSNSAVTGEGWLGDATYPYWIQIYSGLTNGNGWYVSSYTLSYVHTLPTQMASAWVLYGSNDGVDYASLDTRSAESDWGINEMRTYTISSPGVYNYYKFIVSANNVNVNNFISEIELIGDVRSLPIIINALQRIPHDATKYKTNPVELVNISNRCRIGTESDVKISPIMTSNNTPGTYVISANSEYDSTFAAWKALNGVNAINTDAWTGADGSMPNWWKIDFNTPVLAIGYKIAGSYTGSYYPTAWTFSGSNDGSTFIQLDSRSAQTLSGSLSSEYTFTNSTLYRYYRFNISSVNGLTRAILGEVEIYGTTKHNYIGS